MTRKLAISVKHEVAPFLTTEVTLLRKKCAAFDVSSAEFFSLFLQNAFMGTRLLTEFIACISFIRGSR